MPSASIATITTSVVRVKFIYIYFFREFGILSTVYLSIICVTGKVYRGIDIRTEAQ